MTSLQANSFECAILARLAEDLGSRNVTYAMIGGAAVWLLSDGQGQIHRFWPFPSGMHSTTYWSRTRLVNQNLNLFSSFVMVKFVF